jgi:peptidylprolyl isomerase
VKTLIPTIVLGAAIALGGCGDDDSSTTDANGGEATAAVEQSKPRVEVPKGAPPNQLEIEDLVEGDGAEAQPGDEVTVQYVGVDYKKGKEFDASWDRGEPFSFQLGAGMVIPGWEQGVEGMKVGGRRELIIPPGLAYGKAGSPPVIAPNETLVFVVDLIAVD